MNIPVIMMFDDNYAIPAGAAIHSLLENANDKYNYDLFIMHNNITKNHIDKLYVITKKFSFAKLEFIQMNNYLKNYDTMGYPQEILYKFCVSDFFKQYKTAIITDVDVIFTGDVSQEYINFTDDKENYFAGIKQAQYSEQQLFSNNIYDSNAHFIVGAGYMIYNLEKMRDDDISNKCLEYYRKNHKYCKYPEQEVINQICYPKIKLLHPKCMTLTSWYKYQDFMYSLEYCATEQEINEALENPTQLHYVNSPYGEYFKPWQDNSAPKAEIWWKYIQKTPFYYEALKKYYIYKTKKVIQTIFSIKNSNDKKHKIITLLCIKIKHKHKIKEPLIFVYRLDTDNIGDLCCSPHSYFQFYNYKVIDILNFNKIDKLYKLKNKTIVVGGGGLLQEFFKNSVNNLIKLSNYNNVIFWGVGFDRRPTDKRYNDKLLKKCKNVTVRDYNTEFEYVPCVSCMSKLFDQYSNVESEDKIRVYLHKDFYIKELSNYPMISNNAKSMEEVIQFLAGADTIITNSFHGAYWATLLNKKVVVMPWSKNGIIAFSEKFLKLKYKPVYCNSLNKLNECIKKAVNYPEALGDARMYNINFYNRVFSRSAE